MFPLSIRRRVTLWAGALTLFVTPVLVADPPQLVVPGRWEITLQNELPHPTPPATFTVCIAPGAAERPEPPRRKPSDPCQIVSGGIAGNVLSYTSRCGTERSASVRITYLGDRYEGEVEVKERTLELRQLITARRTGACDDAASGQR